MSFWKKLFGNGPKQPEAPQQEERQATEQEIEAAYTKALALLEPFKRTAYLPKTHESKPNFSSHSKIGGLPFIRSKEDWPTCPNCKKHLQLFLQLNLSALPEKPQIGLLQLFYCTSDEPFCETDMESYFAFSKSVVCRIIPSKGEGVSIEPNIDEVFTERIITGWLPKDDYPHSEEYADLGIDLNLENEVYDLMEKREKGLPLDKDKLFGWPYWIQSVEYPFDRKSGEQMDLLFQIDSEDNLPLMFGDSGIAHLTQSPANRNELAFAWACC